MGRFQTLVMFFLTVLFLPLTASAQFAAQYGYGLYGGVGQCGYEPRTAKNAVLNRDEFKEASAEIDALEDAIKDLESEKRDNDKLLKSSTKSIQKVVSSNAWGALRFHWDGKANPEDYQQICNCPSANSGETPSGGVNTQSAVDDDPVNPDNACAGMTGRNLQACLNRVGENSSGGLWSNIASFFGFGQSDTTENMTVANATSKNRTPAGNGGPTEIVEDSDSPVTVYEPQVGGGGGTRGSPTLGPVTGGNQGPPVQRPGQCDGRLYAIPDGFCDTGDNYWKDFVDYDGRLGSQICHTSKKGVVKRSFERSDYDYDARYECETAIEEYYQAREFLDTQGRELAQMKSELARLKAQFKRDVKVATKETEASCPDGSCYERTAEGRKSSTLQTIGNIATTLLGAGLSYKLGKSEQEMNARAGWPTTGTASYGYPFMMAGLYGLTAGMTGQGGFGCSGGINGTGYGMGPYGMASAYGPFSMYGPQMGGAFGYPNGLFGTGMGAGMYMPGMYGPWGNPMMGGMGNMMGMMIGMNAMMGYMNGMGMTGYMSGMNMMGYMTGMNSMIGAMNGMGMMGYMSGMSAMIGINAMMGYMTGMNSMMGYMNGMGMMGYMNGMGMMGAMSGMGMMGYMSGMNSMMGYMNGMNMMGYMTGMTAMSGMGYMTGSNMQMQMQQAYMQQMQQYMAAQQAQQQEAEYRQRTISQLTSELNRIQMQIWQISSGGYGSTQNYLQTPNYNFTNGSSTSSSGGGSSPRR